MNQLYRLPWWLRGKESACNAGDPNLIPGSGRSLGEGNSKCIPVFLAGEFRGQRSLAGYNPWGCKELNTTESLTLTLFWISFLFRSLQSIQFCVVCNRFSLVIYLNIVAIVYIRYYILMKDSIHQEDMTMVNIYTLNLRAPKYIKQTLTELKGETAIQ